MEDETAAAGIKEDLIKLYKELDEEQEKPYPNEDVIRELEEKIEALEKKA